MDSSKSPFDDPKFSGPDESAGNNPASATGIFGKVTSPQAPSPQEDDWLKSLLRTETPSNEENVEATTVTPPAQAASEMAPAPLPPSKSPGSFTQMFQALQSADTQSAKAESIPVSPSRVEHTAPTPAAPVPPKPASDLTSVFTPISVGRAPASPLVPASSGSAEQKLGEFTQLLRTINNPILKTESEPVSSPAVEMPKASVETGSFTQLFKTAPVQPPAPETAFAPVPEEKPPAAPAQTGGPGAFTQMFQTLSPAQMESDKPATPMAAPPSSQQPAAVGGFTQMFQSLSPKAESAPPPQSVSPVAFEPPVAPPKSEPGSFTQMFSQIGGQKTPQEDSLASLKQEVAPQSSFQFSTSTPSSGANPFGTSTPTPRPAPPAQGGFTQLFQALGTENTVPANEPPPLMPSPPAAANPALPAAGGFTQLLRTLNSPPPPSSPPQPAAPAAFTPTPSAPVSSGGPGEFTRIISGSMVREAQSQSVAPGSPVMPPPGQAAGGSQPGFQMPQPPAFPKMPAGVPMPPMHAGAGGGAAPQMPHFQPPAFSFPPAPVPTAPQPPPPSKLQQYLPLILVVNVFVLIVVILIVVFALRHH